LKPARAAKVIADIAIDTFVVKGAPKFGVARRILKVPNDSFLNIAPSTLDGRRVIVVHQNARSIEICIGTEIIGAIVPIALIVIGPALWRWDFLFTTAHKQGGQKQGQKAEHKVVLGFHTWQNFNERIKIGIFGKAR
jgi:hypothetical protein